MRLLIRYTIPDYKENGLIGLDLPDFDFMDAEDIEAAINTAICDQYDNVGWKMVCVQHIDYLGKIQVKPSVPTPSPLNISKKCLACGGEHGNSGLPCPTMTPVAKLL